jgi:hypothetical protein
MFLGLPYPEVRIRFQIELDPDPSLFAFLIKVVEWTGK